MTRVYGAAPGGGDFSPERFFVTIGGMHALDIAVRLTVGPGEEALVPSPAWPNFAGALAANGARAASTCRSMRGDALAARSRAPRRRGRRRRRARSSSIRRPIPTGYVATRRGTDSGSRSGAPPRSLDRRRRNLRPPDLRRPARALVSRHHAAATTRSCSCRPCRRTGR